MIERLMVGVLLVVLINAKFQGISFVVIFSLVTLFIAVKKPYTKNYNNVRSAVNFAVIIIIQCVFLYYSTLDLQNKNKNKFVLYLPLIVCGLLLASVLYNSAAILYSVYQKIQAYRSSQVLEQ